MNPFRPIAAAALGFLVAALIASWSVRDVLLLAHIAVLGAWFGTDIATFALSRRVLDRARPVVARQELAGAMMSIEVIARLCLPAMLVTGVALSVEGGFLDLPRVTIPIVLAAGAAWVGVVWAIHRGAGGSEAVGSLARADLVVRSVVASCLWGASVWSIVDGGGPFVGDWLAVKVGLFALVMTCGIAIRVLLRPFGAAFARLSTEGSTSAVELALADPIRRAQPLVGVIWASLLAAIALAVAKSLPWQ